MHGLAAIDRSEYIARCEQSLAASTVTVTSMPDASESHNGSSQGRIQHIPSRCRQVQCGPHRPNSGFNAIRHAAGTRAEYRLRPVLCDFFKADLLVSWETFDSVDFRDSSRKIDIELKSRSNASGRYDDTIITVHKVEKLLDLIYADLWSVYVVFAFTDKITTCSSLVWRTGAHSPRN